MIDRRRMLALAGVTLASSVFGSRSAEAATGSLMPLWKRLPGGGGPSGPILVGARGAISNIAVPTIERIAPSRPSGTAMLVAAGGGYKRIELGMEARPAAQWLTARGITAFILRYRLPAEGWSDGPLAPLQDAQRALRLIRANAARFQIDPAKLGVLGFSSGGHLLGLAATRSGFASYRATDTADAQSARPAAAALLYPVVTLAPPYDHTSTRRVLIGDHPGAAASAEWSVETHVRSGCPPMFLVQADDDPISDPHNTLILAEACRQAGVSVELHHLASGGHGFGMGSAGSPTGQWPAWYASWLRTRALFE